MIGHTMAQRHLMGVYSLAEQTAHGYPRFTKEEGGTKHHLYRSSKTGRWMAVVGEESIAKNMGSITTKAAAELPTSEGVEWQYYDGSKWVDDGALQCCEVGFRSPA